jgi:hypothetical protein
LAAIFLGILIGCSQYSPVQPTDSPVQPTDSGAAGCGLGPISAPGNTPRPCPITPRCPRVPSATATTLVLVSLCAFGADATSCTPVPSPLCPLLPGNAVLMHLLLYDPNKPGSTCTANVDVRIEIDGLNQTRIFWDAQELEDVPNGGCRNIGPEYQGESAVDGPCCQRTVDISLPVAKRTSRVTVRTDWTESTEPSSPALAASAIELSVPVTFTAPGDGRRVEDVH